MDEEHPLLNDRGEGGEDRLPVRRLVVVEVFCVVRPDHLQLRVVQIDHTGFHADVILEEGVAEGGEFCVFKVQLPDTQRDLFQRCTVQANDRLLVILDSVFCLLDVDLTFFVLNLANFVEHVSVEQEGLRQAAPVG